MTNIQTLLARRRSGMYVHILCQQNLLNMKPTIKKIKFCSHPFRHTNIVSVAAVCAAELDFLNCRFSTMFDFIDETKTMHTPTKIPAKKEVEYISGCKICNTLNDGICMNACIMNGSDRQALIAKYAHMFTDAAKGS